jgi:hypothetical protein
MFLGLILENNARCEPAVDCFAFQFPHCAGGDPAGRASALLSNFARCLNGGLVEGAIPFADLSERPVDGFLYEIAVVPGLAGDDGQEFEERVVWRRFIVNGKVRHEREGGAFFVLGFAAAPGDGLLVCVLCLVEQVTAAAVADCPGVEVL